MVSKETRRKLSVHVTGAKEKSQQNSVTDSAADTSGRSAESTATTASAEEPAEEPAAADGAAANENSSANGNMCAVVADDRVQLIKDMWAFKRSQLLYPSVK